MEEFEIKFFALNHIDTNFEYYSEFDKSELPKYIRKAKKGEIKHIQVRCCKNIGLFENECICSDILNFD